MTGEKEQAAIDKINAELDAKVAEITKSSKTKAEKTFESEMKALRGMAMTDARRQREKIKIAKKYGRTITINGKTFSPKKERAKTRAREEAARTVEKKGSIAKKMTVSKTDIQQAKTANDFDNMQRRIDDLPDGLRKNMMQDMLDKQVKKFEGMQAAELDKAGRKAAQSARDRGEFKGYTPKSPFQKGGMGLKKPTADQKGLQKLPTAVRNKMGYMKRGGMMKSGNSDMRKGGMFYK
tara:strand:- start:144 stop:854 length:711 start_codon:yes stop_codon:yes gene_type:complete